MDAFRRSLIWVERVEQQRGRPVLMRRVGARVSRIPGVHRVRADSDYRSLDLGEDRNGRVVAVYLTNCQLRRRCEGPFMAEVRMGGERTLRLPNHAGCATVKSVSVWRERIAYVLRCSAADRSGVYVARNGRTRRVIPLTAAEAQDPPTVDLAPGLVAAAGDFAGVRIASTEGAACHAVVAAPSGDDLGPLHVSRGRVSWVRQNRGDFGGVETTLHRAEIGPNCAATPLGTPLPLNDLVGHEAFVDSIAIAGTTVYISADGAIFAMSLRDRRNATDK